MFQAITENNMVNVPRLQNGGWNLHFLIFDWGHIGAPGLRARLRCGPFLSEILDTGLDYVLTKICRCNIIILHKVSMAYSTMFRWLESVFSSYSCQPGFSKHWILRKPVASSPLASICDAIWAHDIQRCQLSIVMCLCTYHNFGKGCPSLYSLHLV